MIFVSYRRLEIFTLLSIAMFRTCKSRNCVIYCNDALLAFTFNCDDLIRPFESKKILTLNMMLENITARNYL